MSKKEKMLAVENQIKRLKPLVKTEQQKDEMEMLMGWANRLKKLVGKQNMKPQLQDLILELEAFLSLQPALIPTSIAGTLKLLANKQLAL